MTENKYTSVRVISPHELEARPGPPSDTVRRAESDLIAELARMAHNDGRQFKGWPKLTLVSEYDNSYLRDRLSLRAEVTAVPR